MKEEKKGMKIMVDTSCRLCIGNIRGLAELVKRYGDVGMVEVDLNGGHLDFSLKEIRQKMADNIERYRAELGEISSRIGSEVL